MQIGELNATHLGKTVTVEVTKSQVLGHAPGKQTATLASVDHYLTPKPWTGLGFDEAGTWVVSAPATTPCEVSP